MYAGFVLLGFVLATLVARTLPRSEGVNTKDAVWLRLSALAGAVFGAYLFELPADLLGLTYNPDRSLGQTLIGGRTVLGGILGGWGAVELFKARKQLRGTTGDMFALPLSIALSVGRLGCVTTGCCAGRVIDSESSFAIVDELFHRTPPRFPAALTEAYFHVFAAIGLWLSRDWKAADGLRFPLYVGLYAVVRFSLEFARDNPPMFAWVTWYQLLSVVLLLAAGVRTVVTLRARASLNESSWVG